MRGTIWVWIATKLPPRAPANNFQRAISLRAIAACKFLIPSLIWALKGVIIAIINNPDPNETSAACNPLSNR